jgi:TonB family protein
MLTSSPFPTTHPFGPAAPTPPRAQRTPALPLGAWYYPRTPRSRLVLATAGLLSLGIHVGLLFGLGHAKKKPAPPSAVPTIQLAFTMPPLKELEEPETATSEDDAKTDLSQLVPMQADVPSAALPTDFVQQMDFTSLIERPDLSSLKMTALPDVIRHAGKIGEGIKIFDLASLDRVPEPVVQIAPSYPRELRREGLRVVVKVMFLVDTDGQVTNVSILESEHHGFDQSALTGVSKWRFRAGIKNGRKVVTRMSVPIVFATLDIH